MSTIDIIETAAANTGIDLSRALEHYSSQLAKQSTYRSLRTTRQEVNAAINDLVKAPADEIPNAWAMVVETYARSLAWEELEETLFHRFSRSVEAAAKSAPWTALTLLTGHVEKIGKEIGKLAAHTIDTADAAIADGKVKEYERFEALAAELEQLTTLPELPRNDKDPALVIVKPPRMPQYRNPDRPNPEDHGLEPHTAAEESLHQEALDYSKGDSFRSRLLTAARNGWSITPATSTADYLNRLQQILNGTTYTDATFRYTR